MGVFSEGSDVMTAPRRWSQVIALGLAALMFWGVISQPEGPLETGEDGLFYAMLIALIAVFCGLCFLALKLGTAGSTVYWRADAGSKQVKRIALMVGVALAIQLCVDATLIVSGNSSELSATITGLLVWTLVPAAFLWSGLVTWPRRMSRPSWFRLLLASVVAIGLAAAFTYQSVLISAPETPSFGELSVMFARLVVAAGAEEIVFRVLLLTALLDIGLSRFQAVFLSGVVFAAGHAPLAMAQPITLGDWSLLQHAIDLYGEAFLAQVTVGVGLGVLWLRTGSIALVTLTHALFNVGAALAGNI